MSPELGWRVASAVWAPWRAGQAAPTPEDSHPGRAEEAGLQEDLGLDSLQEANGSQGQTLFLGEGGKARLAGSTPGPAEPGLDHRQQMPAE